MTRSSHSPGKKPVALDELSKLKEIIMSGEVGIGLLKPYDDFCKLDGKPTSAMRQRAREALDKLEQQQNVPGPSTSTLQSYAISTPTTASNELKVRENISVPSTNTLQSDAVSTPTTASNKLKMRKNIPTPSTNTLQSNAVSTPTTTSNKLKVRENIPIPSTSTLQSNADSIPTTASNKLKLWENVPTPSSSTLESDAKSVPNTALASEVIGSLDKAPAAKGSTADYTVIKEIAGALGVVAAPIANATASYWQSRVADSRAELARAQQAEAKAEVAAEKASIRRDQLLSLGVSGLKVVGDIATTYVSNKR